MKNDDKMYIVRKNEQITTILVDCDKNKMFYELPKNYNKLSNKNKIKELKRIKELLDLDIEIIEVDNSDKKTLKYINQNIKDLKTIEYYYQEKLEKLFAVIILFISDYTLSINRLLSLMCTIFSSSHSTKAILENNKRNLYKKEDETLFNKRIKLLISYLLLGINISFGVKNLVVEFDEFKEDTYVLETGIKGMVLSGYQNLTVETIEKPFYGIVPENKKIDLLIDVLRKNEFVDNKDIYTALSLEEYINNNPYFDYQKVYDRFKTLVILESDHKLGTIEAVYYQNINVITNFNNKNESFNEYHRDLFHELVHTTGSFDNKVLTEGMTSLICREYCDDYDDGYDQYVLITKIFCEIVGEDVMLESYSKEDPTILKEALLKINSNEKDYKELMKSLKEYPEDKKDLTYLEFDKLYYAMEPYIKSNQISESQKTTISVYWDAFGYNNDFTYKAYFNHEIETYNYPEYTEDKVYTLK